MWCVDLGGCVLDVLVVLVKCCEILLVDTDCTLVETLTLVHKLVHRFAVGGFPLGSGLVVEDRPSELSYR